MKTCSIAALLTLTALGAAQTKYQVTIGNRKAGSATLLQKVLPDGGKSVKLSMTLATGNGEAVLKAESTYDSKGNPVRKFQETVIASQKMRRTIVVTFDAKGANAVVELNGKRSTKHVPVPETVERADVTEFWFLRDKPKKGAVAKSYHFDLESLTWSMVATTYVGQVEATVGGKKVRAHKTESEQGTALIDDAGMPLRLEFGAGMLERVW